MPDPNSLGQSPLGSAKVLSPSCPRRDVQSCPSSSSGAFPGAVSIWMPGNSPDQDCHLVATAPEKVVSSHRSTTPGTAAVQALRATCSPYTQDLDSLFLPAALSPPFPRWNAAESCRNHGSALCWTLWHRCLSWLVSWCQHCQKPDRHQSTEQWKSELIYLRKKTPKLGQRSGRHRLQALEALVRTTPRNQLYTTEREKGSRGRAHCDPKPCPSTPCTGTFQPSAPFSLHHHESAAGRGGTGPGTSPGPPQLLAFPCSPKM